MEVTLSIHRKDQELSPPPLFAHCANDMTLLVERYSCFAASIVLWRQISKHPYSSVLRLSRDTPFTRLVTCSPATCGAGTFSPSVFETVHSDIVFAFFQITLRCGRSLPMHVDILFSRRTVIWSVNSCFEQLIKFSAC